MWRRRSIRKKVTYKVNEMKGFCSGKEVAKFSFLTWHAQGKKIYISWWREKGGGRERIEAGSNLRFRLVPAMQHNFPHSRDTYIAAFFFWECCVCMHRSPGLLQSNFFCCHRMQSSWGGGEGRLHLLLAISFRFFPHISWNACCKKLRFN